MRVVFDTEFIEDGESITLVSIGMVRADGATYYAVSSDFDPAEANDWVASHVLPHLDAFAESGRTPESTIADEVRAFVGEAPEFWADHGAYDWVVLCQLYGDMASLPPGWPMYCNELVQLAHLVGYPEPPAPNTPVHHALGDALHAADTLRLIERRLRAASFYDPRWRAVLAGRLAGAISERADLAGRFSPFSNFAALAPGQGPAFGPAARPRRLAYAEEKGIVVRSVEAEVRAPVLTVGFEVAFDAPDMAGWGLGELYGEVVAGCAEALVEDTWGRVVDLLGHAGAAPDRTSAVERIASDAGPGPIADVELPSGVVAVLRPQDLVITLSGPLVPTEALAADGEGWTFASRQAMSAALFPAGARRLFAQAPGPA